VPHPAHEESTNSATHVSSPPNLHRLDKDECLAHLAQAVVGRLAVIDGATPTILPVNYALDGEAVVFRTDPGLKLSAGPRGPASFEIDEIDPDSRTGWSVVVTGHLEEVTQYDDRTWKRVRTMPIDPWAGGEKAHWMRLVPTRITGRQVVPHPAS
jgi:nitroimidazol reductase NimA-like FMN-containing flavoprotein (pyridoxamine 5'-phosphate oxidase superfamily)